jgi:hypothetical protein
MTDPTAPGKRTPQEHDAFRVPVRDGFTADVSQLLDTCSRAADWVCVDHCAPQADPREHGWQAARSKQDRPERAREPVY